MIITDEIQARLHKNAKGGDCKCNMMLACLYCHSISEDHKTRLKNQDCIVYCHGSEQNDQDLALTVYCHGSNSSTAQKSENQLDSGCRFMDIKIIHGSVIATDIV